MEKSRRAFGKKQAGFLGEGEEMNLLYTFTLLFTVQLPNPASPDFYDYR
ncbi:MAG: hypothetical protein LBH82_00030 [Bacteroidales bacterium]|nr:hypothetical protein [Bacteroidales bacterium]